MEIILHKEREPQLVARLLDIWEKSVRTSHLFLSPAEIAEIKMDVAPALANISHLVVAWRQKPLGFMGIEARRLEMLFLSPEARGKGIGKLLLKKGIENFGINELTVNAQNPQAVGFYRHMGFEVFKRTEKDEQGRNYPLLYMRLPMTHDSFARNKTRKVFLCGK